METFSITNLLLLLVPVVLLYVLLIYKMYDKVEKIYVSIIFLGLYFYGGIGAAYLKAPASYTIYFLLFLTVFVFIYRVKFLFAHAVKNTFSTFYKFNGATIFDVPLLNSCVIWGYLALELSSLVYPKFNITSLWHPPLPDVMSSLIGTIDVSVENIDVVSKLLFYFKLLGLPLYLLALNAKTTKPAQLFFLLFFPLYIDYCSSAYIARGMILVNLALWLLITYAFNKKLRFSLVTACIFLMPLLLIFFYIYSVARISGDFGADVSGNVIGKLFYNEVSFPDHFAEIVNSGKHVDFPSFLVWLVTLPFPKFLVGGINVPLINLELSEIVIGMNRSDQGFWVELTGYISESYYIFGKYFFWVEAVMVAWLAKVIFYFLRNIKGSLILIYFVAMQFGYTFSRAGIGAVVPNLINGFLAVYVYFAIKAHFKNRSAAKLSAG